MEVNTDKTNSMFMAHHQNTGQNHNLMTAHITLKMEQISYTTLTNQIFLQEDVKVKLSLCFV